MTNFVTSLLLFILFPWQETIVYTPSPGTNREKYFNSNICKRKTPPFERNKLFRQSLPSLTAFFSSLDGNFTGLVRQKGT